MRLRRIAAGTTLLVLLTACGGASPTTGPGTVTPGPAAVTTAPGATTAPVVTTPPVVTTGPEVTTPPSDTAAPVVTQQPFPSFAGDPDLAAQFPTQVDGNPVTGVTTARLVDYFAAFQAPQDQIDKIRAGLASIGIDMNNVIIGLASATVNESPVGIEAFRVPGQDANTLIQANTLFSAHNEGDVLAQETVGGKSAWVVRNGGYASLWMYPHGDVLWSLNTSSQNEATAVFTALP